MKINGQPYRTIWINDQGVLSVINQVSLPHAFEVTALPNVDAVCQAISNMIVRGAGLIGATAGYGMWLAAKEAPTNDLKSFNTYIQSQASRLRSTRPTASNLAWAIERQLSLLQTGSTIAEKVELAKAGAVAIANEDVQFCRQIGQHGLGLIKELAAFKLGKTINVFTKQKIF